MNDKFYNIGYKKENTTGFQTRGENNHCERFTLEAFL